MLVGGVKYPKYVAPPKSIIRIAGESSYFMALLSTHSVSKVGYVQKELKKAMDILDQHPASKIFVVPVRIDPCNPEEERLKSLHWADLFTGYDACLTRLLKVFGSTQKPAKPRQKRIEPSSPVSVKLPPVETKASPHKPGKYDLRSQPLDVSEDECNKVFRLNDGWRPLEYIPNEYTDNGDRTVLDHATGLMWQQSGSKEWLTYDDGKKYVEGLNMDRFAGYDDWRLPTIDELTSLLEPEKKDNGLYIDPIFDKNQWWCWSADTVKGSSGRAWRVDFTSGGVVSFPASAAASMCVRFAPDNVENLTI